jgi:AcrR family transcriptional regulator
MSSAYIDAVIGRRMPADAKPAAARRYHHGGLREAMVAATVQLVEDLGAERVTVREAARQAGVSSGAPFRHFPNRTALMTAVAEEGMLRLSDAISERLAAVGTDDPFVRLSALGDAYFAWAVGNPTHYRVLGDRLLIDFDGSEIRAGRAAAIRADMSEMIGRAHERGLLRPCDPELVHLEARALSYGLARMHVDAHLREWAIPPDQALAAMRRVMDDFIVNLARDPQAARAAIAAARGA